MSNITNLTGNKAFFAFDSSDFWIVRSMSGISFSRPVVNDSNLSSTNYEQLIPGDLVSIDALEMEVMWDVTLGSNYRPSASANPFNQIALGQLYFPPGNVTGAYVFAGTGFLTGWDLPAFSNNERNIGAIRFTFDNKGTPPAWSQVA